MTSTQMPTRLAMPQPFASGANATRATIGSVSGNSVNYPDGFPAVYSSPASEGGKYVSRGEMNAIGNMASNDLHYFKCGGLNTFDAAFAAAVGGYPKGAVLDYIVGYKLYKVISLVDSNTVDYTAVGVDGENWQWLNSNIPEVDPGEPVSIGNISFSGGNSTSGDAVVLPVLYAKASGMVSLTPGGAFSSTTSLINQGTAYYDNESRVTILLPQGTSFFYRICGEDELSSLEYPEHTWTNGFDLKGKWHHMLAPGMGYGGDGVYIFTASVSTTTGGGYETKVTQSYGGKTNPALSVPRVEKGQYIAFAVWFGLSLTTLSFEYSTGGGVSSYIAYLEDVTGTVEVWNFDYDVTVTTIS